MEERITNPDIVQKLVEDVSNLITGNYSNKYLKFPGNVAVAYGTETKNVSGNTIAFTFPTGLFAEAPTVVASTGAGSYRTPIYVEDVTKNGFSIYKDNGNSGNIWIRWIAIGKY